MNCLDRLREWVSVHLALVIFLLAYFSTIVLGNIIYLMPFVRPYLDVVPYTSRIFELDTLFSFGYWVLLLSPFVIAPLIVWGVRQFLRAKVARVVAFFPDFTRGSYLLLLFMCYLLVIFAFWRADAFRLFVEGRDFASSVEARFEIRARIGFLHMALLMSNLHFLSVYGVVQVVRRGGVFWWVISLLNIMLVSVLLVLLNMKWPVIIFYAGLVMAVFVYVVRNAFSRASIGGVFLLLVYISISAFVYRLHAVEVDQSAGGAALPESSLERSRSLGIAVLESVPMMFFHAVNRMAVAYPYYYDFFTHEGQICGGLAAQLQAGQACRPSFVIYNLMFDDQFQGRGTVPAPVHVTAYALGGWPLAAAGLVCASIVLGLFASLPLRENALVGAMAITGGVVGYHLSQLPGEGPFFYDHGIFWTLLMLFGYAVLVKIYRRIIQ